MIIDRRFGFYVVNLSKILTGSNWGVFTQANCVI